ncbi:unnamed protein product, partial [Closterium sp. Naga37s-1]
AACTQTQTSFDPPKEIRAIARSSRMFLTAPAAFNEAAVCRAHSFVVSDKRHGNMEKSVKVRDSYSITIELMDPPQ